MTQTFQLSGKLATGTGAGLGLVATLNLDMRHGESGGAAMALDIPSSALAARSGMATFVEAGVTDRNGAE